MSALYTSQAFAALVSTNIATVSKWIADNPGKSISDCATATTVPYEAVYQIVSQGDFVILPNAPGELQFGPQHGYGKP